MTKAHLEGIRSFLTNPDYSGPLGVQHAGLELLAEVDRLSTVEKERDGLREATLEEAALACDRMVIGGRAWNSAQRTAAEALFAAAKYIRSLKASP